MSFIKWKHQIRYFHVIFSQFVNNVKTLACNFLWVCVLFKRNKLPILFPHQIDKWTNKNKMAEVNVIATVQWSIFQGIFVNFFFFTFYFSVATAISHTIILLLLYSKNPKGTPINIRCESSRNRMFFSFSRIMFILFSFFHLYSSDRWEISDTPMFHANEHVCKWKKEKYLTIWGCIAKFLYFLFSSIFLKCFFISFIVLFQQSEFFFFMWMASNNAE